MVERMRHWLFQSRRKGVKEKRLPALLPVV